MTVKQNKGDTENINNYLKLAPLLLGGVPDAVGGVGLIT
jgi:hypothetical protein